MIVLINSRIINIPCYYNEYNNNDDDDDDDDDDNDDEGLVLVLLLVLVVCGSTIVVSYSNFTDYCSLDVVKYSSYNNA